MWYLAPAPRPPSPVPRPPLFPRPRDGDAPIFIMLLCAWWNRHLALSCRSRPAFSTAWTQCTMCSRHPVGEQPGGRVPLAHPISIVDNVPARLDQGHVRTHTFTTQHKHVQDRSDKASSTPTRAPGRTDHQSSVGSIWCTHTQGKQRAAQVTSHKSTARQLHSNTPHLSFAGSMVRESTYCPPSGAQYCSKLMS